MFQNTRKVVLNRYANQVSNSSTKQLEILKGLPFYNWPSYQDGEKGNISLYQQLEKSNNFTLPQTDFNHAIGLPQKNGIAMPLFDYEQMLFDTLQSNKHVWVKKATGLGITEFMLRYMALLCFSNNISKNSQMCIVTGPRIELAITLIDRMKGLFRAASSSNPISFDTKETVIELNGVHIEAYPSHHLDSMRGLANVSFIYLDEADFFPPGQQQDLEMYQRDTSPSLTHISLWSVRLMHLKAYSNA